MRSSSDSPSGNTKLSSLGTGEDSTPSNASSSISETEVHALGSAAKTGEPKGGKMSSPSFSLRPRSRGDNSPGRGSRNSFDPRGHEWTQFGLFELGLPLQFGLFEFGLFEFGLPLQFGLSCLGNGHFCNSCVHHSRATLCRNDGTKCSPNTTTHIHSMLS